jgi:hypothetical protein
MNSADLACPFFLALSILMQQRYLDVFGTLKFLSPTKDEWPPVRLRSSDFVPLGMPSQRSAVQVTHQRRGAADRGEQIQKCQKLRLR